MVKKEELKGHYIFLWILVLAITLIVIFSHMVYLVGHGRWECVEYKTYCNKCEVSGSKIIKIEQQEIEMNWRTENERKCICTDYETECVREIWTRKRGSKN